MATKLPFAKNGERGEAEKSGSRKHSTPKKNPLPGKELLAERNKHVLEKQRLMGARARNGFYGSKFKVLRASETRALGCLLVVCFPNPNQDGNGTKGTMGWWGEEEGV